MIAVLSSIILELSAAAGIGVPPAEPVGNVCCVLPSGEQCCSPTTDTNGRPSGCGC